MSYIEDVPWQTAVGCIICQDDLIADLRCLHDQQTRVTSDFSPESLCRSWLNNPALLELVSLGVNTILVTVLF